MRLRQALFTCSTLLPALLVATAVSAQPAKPYGAATPQEAVAQFKKAVDAKDFVATVPLVAPAALKDMANEGVSGLLMVLAFSDPADPMPGGPKKTKAELDADIKKYKEATDLAKGVLKPYGLDTFIGKPVLSDPTQKALNAALDKTDNVVLITALYKSLDKIGPLLGMKEKPEPKAVMNIGNVTGYSITGDKAIAKNGPVNMNFIKIDNRWYIVPPPGAQGK